MPAPSPPSRGAGAHARPCEGNQPSPRPHAVSSLVLTTRELGPATRTATDAADPVPVVRRPRGDRVLLRRPGGGRLSARSVGADRRAVGGVPVLPRQPEGAVPRALGAHARLPAVVRPDARHGDA